MALFGTLMVEPGDGPPIRYSLEAARITVGRGPENEVVLLDLKVSRRHAEFLASADRVVVEDLGSANGFKHNGHRVRRALLASGDTLVIGTTRLTYFSAECDLQEQETAVTAWGEVMEQTITDHSVARLVVSYPNDTRAYPMSRDKLTIGRSSKVDVVIDDVNVSRLHAIVRKEGGRYLLKDNGSRNGTLVAGEPIEEIELRSSLTFEIGETRILFQAPYDPEELSVVETAINPTAGKLVSARRRPSIERVGDRGDPGDRAPQAVPPRAPTRAVASGRQAVIVIPGFMGSTLLRGGELIWPDVKRFLKRPEFLRLPDTLDLTPGDLVSEVVVVPGLVKLDAYNRLADFLEEGLDYRRGANLFTFAYDWRRDLRHAARELGESIAAWEELADLRHGKFVLIAHSAGGLVARYYIERMGGRHHVDRLILMGSPNRGTLKTLSAMLGGQSLLPFGARKERMRDVMATFPAAYQLLPIEPAVFDAQGRAIDIFDDKRWLPEAAHPMLDDARAFVGELGTRSRVPVVSIFGYGQRTIVRIVARRDDAGKFVSFSSEEDEHGDGTVRQAGAVLEGSEIHPVRQHHGALYTDNDVKMRLRLELLGQPS